MTATGFVVYLKATVREQVRRTAKDSKRPLLAGKNRSQVLSDLFALRDPLYSGVADLTLPTAGKNARQLAELIAAAVELQPV
jgi:shikimate kinase